MTGLYTPLASDQKEALILQQEAILPPQAPLLKQLLAHKGIVVGTLLLFVICLMAIFGPYLTPYTFEGVNLPSKNMPPSFDHPFGTDDLGRDLWTRVCYGLRLSLEIGIIAALVDLLLGLTWGITSGLIGGTYDQVMMRIAEMIYCLPYLLFVILVTAIMGAGILPIIAAMVLIGWIQMARISRNLVIQVKQAEFVTAAYALGITPFAIVFRHILPNIAGPIVCVMMLTIPQAIFSEAFLSFLGIGIQPPQASLGSLVSDSLASMRFYPWRLFFPSIVITMTIFAFNLLGDAIRDMLDPQTRACLKEGK